MVEYTPEVYDAIKEVARLKGHKTPNGTKIYYAEKRLQQLKDNNGKKSRSKRSPRSPQPKKTVKAYNAKGSLEGRAYVLSRETQDLVQAIEALEGLRK